LHILSVIGVTQRRSSWIGCAAHAHRINVAGTELAAVLHRLNWDGCRNPTRCRRR